MTVPPKPAADQGRDARLDLIWSAWAELGLSGWARNHQTWAIDPEPLILSTAGLRRTDPRLHDEALDWCIHNWRLISRVRLRNLLRGESAELHRDFAHFAATVNERGGATWPGAGTSITSYRTTGRSAAPDLARSSMVWLRMRNVFGIGARTEVFRYFLSKNSSSASLTAIAERSGYTKRNVADACTALERAGYLRARQTRNRLYYSLADETVLSEFVGPIARIRPDWTALLDVLRQLEDLETTLQTLPDRARRVEADRSLLELADDLDRLDLTGPSSSTTALQYIDDLRLAWAAGRWPATST